MFSLRRVSFAPKEMRQKKSISFCRTAVIRLYFGFVLFFFFALRSQRKRKDTKRKRNQRNHLEFARILVHKFSGTRPQKFASKIQQFYDADKQLRCNYAPSGHPSLRLEIDKRQNLKNKV